MAEEPTTSVEGAPGASETPTAGEVNLDELVAELGKAEPAKAEPATQLDEEFAKKLESLDPGALPESVRRKLESPFLSQYNKKTTEWDQERQRLMGMIEKLSSRPADAPQATVDQREVLRQKIAEGDFQAADQLIELLVDQKYGPQQRQISMKEAIEGSVRLFPDSAKMEPEIAQTLRDNPGIAAVIHRVSTQDPGLGATLLAGVAKNLAFDRAIKERDDAIASIPAKIKAGIEEYKRRISGLPSSTSRAGTTPVGEPSKANMSLEDAMEKAWQEQVRG